MKGICVFVLAFVSVYGKVIIQDRDISEAINSNSIHVDSKNEIISNAKVNVENNIEHANTSSDSKKTCNNDLDDNTIGTGENGPCGHGNKEDNGVALLLTPFIEESRLEEARSASRVDPDLFLGVESYSGFLTVDKNYESHLFFWYFPYSKPGNDTPWIIWLQGGPGASSMTGLFDEIGPFHVNNNGQLERNPYTWLQNHSLVFIDNPVGTGFSFTNHRDGYARDMDTYGAHLYSVVKQLVQIYPELRTAPLYIAGESYAGKYVPTLGIQIHRHRDAPGGDINLKGVMIGNAYVEPAMITEIVRPFYHFGLLEKEQIDAVTPLVKAFQDDVANNRSEAAKQKWNTLVTVFLMLSHQSHAYNFLQDEMQVGKYFRFLTKSAVKKAIHVGDIRFNFLNVTVNAKLAGEFLTSAKPLFEELLEHYRVMAFCGQLDQMLPCALSSDMYRGWRWSRAQDFLSAERRPYLLRDTLAGYAKSGGNMTWVVLRGAGHMAAMDSPHAAQTMAAYWTHGLDLPAANQPISVISRLLLAKETAPQANATEDMRVANNTVPYL